MLAIRVIALVLIVASATALATFAGFDEYSTHSRAELARGIDIPMWIGASGLVLGALLLIGFAKRR
jgi:hypothetical protein